MIGVSDSRPAERRFEAAKSSADSSMSSAMAHGDDPASDAKEPNTAAMKISTAACRGLLTGLTAMPSPMAMPKLMLAEVPASREMMIDGIKMAASKLKGHEEHPWQGPTEESHGCCHLNSWVIAGGCLLVRRATSQTEMDSSGLAANKHGQARTSTNKHEQQWRRSGEGKPPLLIRAFAARGCPGLVRCVAACGA